MSNLGEIIENIRRDIPRRINDDKFSSWQLRQMIIDKIAGVKLSETSTLEFYDKLSIDEKIKIDYLSRCAALGADICKDLLKKSFTGQSCCYHEYMLIGAFHIGQEIGMEYAQILYPELRSMRELGIAHEVPDHEPEIIIESYGFTVHRYDDHSFEISNAKPLPNPPQFELFYDDINERHIEQYSFPDWEQADNARNTWERFISGKEPSPPVKYGFEIIDDPVTGKTVHAVIPLNEDASDSMDVSVDGRQKKLKVFKTLEKALQHNRKALDVIDKTPIPPPLPKIIPEKEKTRPIRKAKPKDFSTPVIAPSPPKKTKKTLEK